MFLRIITWMVVIGVILRVFNKYIRPVFKIGVMANDHMRKMQEQMQEQMQRMESERMQQPQPAQQKKQVKKEGDYIDYEEIK